MKAEDRLLQHFGGPDALALYTKVGVNLKAFAMMTGMPEGGDLLDWYRRQTNEAARALLEDSDV